MQKKLTLWRTFLLCLLCRLFRESSISLGVNTSCPAIFTKVSQNKRRRFQKQQTNKISRHAPHKFRNTRKETNTQKQITWQKNLSTMLPKFLKQFSFFLFARWSFQTLSLCVNIYQKLIRIFLHTSRLIIKHKKCVFEYFPDKNCLDALWRISLVKPLII